MYFIETRFHDNGKSEAKLHESIPAYPPEYFEKFDSYVDSHETLEDFAAGLEIELDDDVASLVAELESGDWVDITEYCRKEHIMKKRILGYEKIRVLSEFEKKQGHKILLYEDTSSNADNPYGIIFEVPYKGIADFDLERNSVLVFDSIERAIDEFACRIKHYLKHAARKEQAEKQEMDVKVVSAVISAALHKQYERESAKSHKEIIGRAVAIRDALSPLHPLTEKGWESVLKDIGSYVGCLIML